MTTSPLLKFDFLTALARSLHQSGAGTHELENDLISISKKLDVEGDFFITPTSISMTLSSDGKSLSKNMRLFPKGTSISKMNKLRKIASEAATEKINLESAIRLIEEKVDKSIFDSTIAVLISFSLVSSCLTILMGGAFGDFCAASVTGLITGLLSIFLTNERILPIKETLIAFAVAFLVFLFDSYVFKLNQNTVILSSLIVLIPGLSFTIALSELANRHLSSGTARMMGSIIDFFKLGAGIVAAHYFASNFLPPSVSDLSGDIVSIAKPIAVLICSAAAAVIFNAAKDEIIWIVTSAMIVVHSLDFFELVSSSNMAIFLSSFLAGLLSNLYAKFKNKSANTLLLPSIVFLVPGALGLKGINYVLDNNIHSGGEQIGASIIAAGLIVAGIFFADAITPTAKINLH